MKILLVATNTATTPYPAYPLGLSMIAASLKNAGHDVCQFDFLASGQSVDALCETVKQVAPELIGISIRNIDNVNLLNEQRYIDAVRDIVANLRAHSQAKILLGGSGFSLMPNKILDRVEADFGICGEGEQLVVEFAANAEEGRYPSERIVDAGAKLIGDMIPSALHDPATLAFYLRSGSMGSVQTKRGCPFSCIYCTYPMLEGADIRPRDPVTVIDDVQELMDEHGAKYIFFTDSVFNDTSGQYMDVVREMARRGINVPWTAFFKPGGLDNEQVALMRSTGLHTAEVGADAPSDTTLQNLGKDFCFDDVISCNNLFRKHGVATAHYFMFGCPGETEETVIEGIANIKALTQTAAFVFMGIRIIPNTVLEEVARRDGVLDESHDMLEPVFYISPNIDRNWLETTLTDAFAGCRHCIFPPDSMESSLSFLHRMGHIGSALDLLVKPSRRKGRKPKQ